MAPRAGVTLTELLVVIGIVAALMLLALPAINSARESSRRAQCTARLARMAMAMAQYEVKNGSLPGWRNRLDLTSGTVPCQATSVAYRQAPWVVMLFPHLDRNDLFLALAANEQWSDVSATKGVLIDAVLCPSFYPPPQQYPYSVLQYGANCGTGTNDNDGVLVDNFSGKRRSLDDVAAADGLSTTLLHCDMSYGANEWPGGWGPAWHEEKGFWSFGGTPSVRTGPIATTAAFSNSKMLPFGTKGTVQKQVVNGLVSQRTLPRSKHPDGAVAAFADGSTRFLKESLKPHVYAHLVTAQSGWNATTKSYTPVNSTESNSWLRAAGAPPVAEEPFRLTEADYQ